VIEENLAEVRERQGLNLIIECRLQIIDNICIKISLINRNKIKGFPIFISRLEWSCKGNDPTTLFL
jgi:hypothetical protein